MGTVSIKIRNLYGVNKLKGEDLTVEESLALIDLARSIALQGEARLETTPIQVFEGYSPNTYSEPVTGLHIADDLSEDNSTEECSNEVVEANTNVEPVTDDVVEESTVKIGLPTMADAMTNAFAAKFSTLPTTPGEDTSILSDEERLEELNKDFYETGVKHKLYGGEILPFYRVRWECPKCGDKGNHYGPENIKQMFCYNCKASLTVRPAAGRFPNRDDWGNFFVADELNMKFIRA